MILLYWYRWHSLQLNGWYATCHYDNRSFCGRVLQRKRRNIVERDTNIVYQEIIAEDSLCLLLELSLDGTTLIPHLLCRACGVIVLIKVRIPTVHRQNVNGMITKINTRPAKERKRKEEDIKSLCPINWVLSRWKRRDLMKFL